jgi:hypothetical protein
MKLEIDTTSISPEEARALAIFLLELRNIDRSTIADETADAGNPVVDASDERSVDSGPGEGASTAPRRGPGRPKRTDGEKNVEGISKTSPVFVLQNKAAGVSFKCDTGRKGHVEAAKANLETWLRDSGSVEAVAQLAADNEDFVVTCFSKTEQRAFARLVTESRAAHMPEVAEAALFDSNVPAAPAVAETTEYTIDAVRLAAKSLAIAQKLAAVETVLAKFDAKTIRDLKESQYGAVIEALNTAMGQ